MAPPASLPTPSEEPAATAWCPFPAGPAPALPLCIILSRCRGGVLGVVRFSAAANVLLLVVAVYLLQISDRVLPSASHATLLALTGMAVFLSSCFGLPDCAR